MAIMRYWNLPSTTLTFRAISPCLLISFPSSPAAQPSYARAHALPRRTSRAPSASASSSFSPAKTRTGARNETRSVISCTTRLEKASPPVRTTASTLPPVNAASPQMDLATW